MTDVKVFRVESGCAREMVGGPMTVEDELQTLVERNMETMLGVRFLATEYSTGDGHGGRIDSLGLDESGSPVIVEYKRSRDSSVMNQALFYLDWLVGHRWEFSSLVQRSLGLEAAEAIDWSHPRMICVAAEFTRYDTYAVRHLGQSMDLVRYRAYGPGLFTLELLASSVGRAHAAVRSERKLELVRRGSQTIRATESDRLKGASSKVRTLYEKADGALLSMGRVQRVPLQTSISYRVLRAFAWMRIQKHGLVVTLSLSPEAVELVPGFTRDVREVGHHGGGQLEVRIRTPDDVRAAEPLFRSSFAAL